MARAPAGAWAACGGPCGIPGRARRESRSGALLRPGGMRVPCGTPGGAPHRSHRSGALRRPGGMRVPCARGAAPARPPRTRAPWRPARHPTGGGRSR
ncbi:hypothetical protein CA983_14875 [Streptomyces swartbergensis]|uniref:Uncharacterized protein n=1 Tax=Streptomyces swartbergensis TaxID=487165 RepID=A0A243S4F5_9ACTN|nr:hypothetical protein CA983_14875 [Streptomyces swartbergensis]